MGVPPCQDPTEYNRVGVRLSKQSRLDADVVVSFTDGQSLRFLTVHGVYVNAHRGANMVRHHTGIRTLLDRALTAVLVPGDRYRSTIQGGDTEFTYTVKLPPFTPDLAIAWLARTEGR